MSLTFDDEKSGDSSECSWVRLSSYLSHHCRFYPESEILFWECSKYCFIAYQMFKGADKLISLVDGEALDCVFPLTWLFSLLLFPFLHFHPLYFLLLYVLLFPLPFSFLRLSLLKTLICFSFIYLGIYFNLVSYSWNILSHFHEILINKSQNNLLFTTYRYCS